jgi:hypothetical protein
LEGEGGKLIEELDLFVHLLEESTPKVARLDGSPEKRDAGAADVVDVVDRRLGLVQGEGRAARGEEGGNVVDGRRVVGEDDNVVEVGEDDGRGRVGIEGGEMGLEIGKGVADGKGEEEGGEGISLTNT